MDQQSNCSTNHLWLPNSVDDVLRLAIALGAPAVQGHHPKNPAGVDVRVAEATTFHWTDTADCRTPHGRTPHALHCMAASAPGKMQQGGCYAGTWTGWHLSAAAAASITRCTHLNSMMWGSGLWIA